MDIEKINKMLELLYEYQESNCECRSDLDSAILLVIDLIEKKEHLN